jgi:acyl carrier protein
VHEAVQLVEVIGSVLGVDPSCLDDTVSSGNLDSWDSLTHVTLITVIEETYEVTLTTTEMRECRSVGALRSVLASKGVDV